ncbi:MAG TPA: LLM class flavin-dependent oxidoreductase [Candidatus Bathyarchaeia archaeon]|nr:LLM class flavin-dependent oxidoreductase [Candidatus Bathyarchaeia archaeon]
MKAQSIKHGFKVPFYPLDLIYDSALFAEEKGFDSAWSADHMVGISTKNRQCFSAWEIMSALAVKTNRIQLGTSVSDPCRLHPAIIAQMAVTLNHISKNRFSLGMGAGEAQNNAPYGIDCSHPVKRLEESIEIIRELVRGEEVTHKGRFFNLRNAIVSPGLPTDALKIWMGANSKKTLEMTARLADGWLPIACIFPPDSYRATLQVMKTEATRAGRDPDSVEPGLFLHVAIAKRKEDADRMAEHIGKLQLVGWVPEIFKEIGESSRDDFHFKNLIFDDLTSRRLDEVLQKLPMAPVYERLAVGTPEQCLEKIDSFVKAGARHIVASFMCPPDKLLESMRLYEHTIISYYKSKS